MSCLVYARGVLTFIADFSGLFPTFCLAGVREGSRLFSLGALNGEGVRKYLPTFLVRGVLLSAGWVLAFIADFSGLVPTFCVLGCWRRFPTLLFGRLVQESICRLFRWKVSYRLSSTRVWTIIADLSGGRSCPHFLFGGVLERVGFLTFSFG